MAIQIEDSWKQQLQEEFSKEYFQGLTAFVKDQYQKTKVFPPPKLIFNAFDSTPFEEVKVVIIGQDPYHGEGQAHGLSFSVPDGVKVPPSLQNIFKEIKEDLGFDPPDSGNLEHWAKQGVLLLNATLTVQAHEAGSHQKKGWEEFTNAAIQKLSSERKGLVFMLWGNYAKEKKELIDAEKHLILEAAHPSPFSAHNGFFGCKHFSKANLYLLSQMKLPIVWGSKNT